MLTRGWEPGKDDFASPLTSVGVEPFVSAQHMLAEGRHEWALLRISHIYWDAPQPSTTSSLEFFLSVSSSRNVSSNLKSHTFISTS